MELSIKPKILKKLSMETSRTSLEVPEERPLFRRSTSPMIVLSNDPSEEETILIGPTSKSASQTPTHTGESSPSTSQSPAASRSSSRKNSEASKSGSRKNSFVMCLTPNRSPSDSPEETRKNFLSPADPYSFNLPKSKVKLLKKTASVKQLYHSVLQALRTISRSKGDIAPELTKSFFENILRDAEGQSGIQVTRVHVKDSSEFGRHFCSEVHAVEVLVKLEGRDQVYELIIKSQPQSEDARNFLKPSHTFEKEVQMYSSVFVDMAKFVKSHRVLPSGCHESEVVDIPRCYYTRWTGDSSTKEDMIIMENLIPLGFISLQNRNVEKAFIKMDRPHAELTMKEIAKFHAISFCMKEGNSQNLLNRYTQLREDSLYREETYEFTNRTLTPIMASLAELIRTTADFANNYTWFVELARNFHNIQIEMVSPANHFAVICHGDLWWSNILFKYDQEDPPKPVEVKFIDFQSSRVSSLVTDLLAFFFTSLPSDIRKYQALDLLQIYYSTFISSTASLNFSQPIFTFEELQREFRQHLLFGFIEGIWYLDIIYKGERPVQSTETEDSLSLGEGKEAQNWEEDWEFREIKERERELFAESESENQANYRRDFLTLLDDILFLSGATAKNLTNITLQYFRQS